MSDHETPVDADASAGSRKSAVEDLFLASEAKAKKKKKGKKGKKGASANSNNGGGNNNNNKGLVVCETHRPRVLAAGNAGPPEDESDLSERDVARQRCVLYEERQTWWPEAVRDLDKAIARMKEETRANPRLHCACQPKMLPVFTFHSLDADKRYFVGVLRVQERSRRQGTKIAEVQGIEVGSRASDSPVPTERTVVKLYGESARMPAHEHDIVLVEEIVQEEALELVNDQDNFRYEEGCHVVVQGAGQGAGQSEMFAGIRLGKVVAILHSHVRCNAGNPAFLAHPSRCQDSLFVNSDGQHLSKLTPFSNGLPVVLAAEPPEQNIHELDYASVQVQRYAQTSVNGLHELPMPEAEMTALENGDHATALKLYSGYSRWFEGEEPLCGAAVRVPPLLGRMGGEEGCDTVYGADQPLLAVDAKGTVFPEDGMVVVDGGVDVVLSLAGHLLLDAEVRRAVCVRPSSLFSRVKGTPSEHMLPKPLRERFSLRERETVGVVVVRLRTGCGASVTVERCRFARLKRMSFEAAELDLKVGGTKGTMRALWRAVDLLRNELDPEGQDEENFALSGEELVGWLMETANAAIQAHVLGSAAWRSSSGLVPPKLVLIKTLRDAQLSLEQRREELGGAYDDVMRLCRGRGARFGRGKRAELLGLVRVLEGVGSASIADDGCGRATFSSPVRKAGDMLNQLALLVAEGAVARAEFDSAVKEVEEGGMMRGVQVMDSTQHELDRLYAFQCVCDEFVRLRGRLVIDPERHSVAFHARMNGVAVSPQRLHLTSFCPCVQDMEGDECEAWCTVTKAAQSSRLFAVAVQAVVVDFCVCNIKEQCIEHNTFPSAFHGVLRVRMGRLSRAQIRKAHDISTIGQVIASFAKQRDPNPEKRVGFHQQQQQQQHEHEHLQQPADKDHWGNDKDDSKGNNGKKVHADQDLVVVPRVTIKQLRERQLRCSISSKSHEQVRRWQDFEDEAVCVRVPCAKDDGPGYHIHGTFHVEEGANVVVRLPPERETVSLRPLRDLLEADGRVKGCVMEIYRRRRYCAHTTPTFRNKDEIEPVWNDISERRRCASGVGLGSRAIVKALENEEAAIAANNASGGGGGGVQQEGRGLSWLEQLDDEKRDALRVCARSRVFALHGPAGTGKSKFVSALVCLALKAKWRVLVVSQQNVAVDNLRDAIREQMREVFHYKETKARAVAVCVKASEKHEDGVDQPDTACDKAKVVMCTIGTMLVRRRINALDYELVIVDEAGTVNDQQMSHCWAMASKQVVLVGDHRQLPPYTASLDDFVAERVVQDTVFEQVCTEGQAYGVEMRLLTVNHRMHPNIMARPSELFYEGKLQGVARPCKSDAVQAVVDELCSQRDGTRVLLADVRDGYEKLDGTTRSPFNEREVDEVVNIFGWLLHKGVQAKDILVVTPYEKQKSRLNDALQEHLQRRGLPDNVRADTIDGVQGNEGAVVVISWVRTPLAPNNLLFLTNRRVNVAITRARDLLIHVCNVRRVRNNPLLRRVLHGVTPVA